jgi:hypothetical protein
MHMHMSLLARPALLAPEGVDGSTHTLPTGLNTLTGRTIHGSCRTLGNKQLQIPVGLVTRTSRVAAYGTVASHT